LICSGVRRGASTLITADEDFSSFFNESMEKKQHFFKGMMEK
jgi:hypothetical protein